MSRESILVLLVILVLGSVLGPLLHSVNAQVLAFKLDGSTDSAQYQSTLDCESIGGSWSNETFACAITGNGGIESGDSLIINYTATLVTATGATFTNEGTITNNGGIFANNGTLDNGGLVTNYDAGTITNNVGASITNSGTFNDQLGTFTNSGNVTNDNRGIIVVTGTLANPATINDNGNITVYAGTLVNNGTIAVNSGGAVDVKSSGEIANSGSITVNGQGNVTVTYGNIINNNGGIIGVKSGGNIANYGTITNNVGASITNSGTITNEFYSAISKTTTCPGTFVNEGALAGNQVLDNCGSTTRAAQSTSTTLPSPSTTGSRSSISESTTSLPVPSSLPFWLGPVIVGAIVIILVGGYIGYRRDGGQGGEPKDSETPGGDTPGIPTTPPSPNTQESGGDHSEKPKGSPTTPDAPVPYGTSQSCVLSSHWLHSSLDLGIPFMGTKASPVTIRRAIDEPLPLKAEASDYHILVQECACSGSKTEKSIKMAAHYRISWDIIQGGGGFVEKSGATILSQSDGGEEVLYQPARIGPNSEGQVNTVKVRVRSIHDDPSKPPDHAKVESRITIEVSKAIAASDGKDEYVYRCWVEEGDPVFGPSPPRDNTGQCSPVPSWLQAEPIQGEIYKMPQTCNKGDFVRFGAMGTDVDNLQMVCIPNGGSCEVPSPTTISPLGDPLTYSWRADKGEFAFQQLEEKAHPGVPAGANYWEWGQTVVWHAPDQDCFAKITLLMTDSGREFSDEAVELNAYIVVGSPATDPPPTLPVPAQPGTNHSREDTCEIKVEVHSSERYVNASDESLREKVEVDGTWASAKEGTAIAISEGASVGGTISVEATMLAARLLNIDPNGLKQTNEIICKANGNTKIAIEIEAAKDTKTGISAAVITALEADASVLEIPEWLYEDLTTAYLKLSGLELEGMGSSVIEAISQYKDRKEIIEKIKEIIDTLTKLKNGAKSAAAAAGLAEAIELWGSLAVEKVGGWMLLNGNVDVAADGEMTVEVGQGEGSKIEAKASRKFEMETKLSLQEGTEVEISGREKDVMQDVESGSAPRMLEINLDGDAGVEGSAYKAGWGEACLNSIWAVAWLAGCQERRQPEGEIPQGKGQYGYRIGGRFILPPSKIAEYPTQDIAVIKNIIEAHLKENLEGMLQDADPGLAVDDPPDAEELLRNILKRWMVLVQDETGRFVKNAVHYPPKSPKGPPTQPPESTGHTIESGPL